MKEWLTIASEHAIVVIDALALIVILGGTLEAAISSLRLMFAGFSNPGAARGVAALCAVAGRRSDVSAGRGHHRNNDIDELGRHWPHRGDRPDPDVPEFLPERDVEEVRLRQRESRASVPFGEGAAR